MNVESRVQTVCLVILSTVAMGAALYWLKPVLIPFTLAVFVSLGLGPAVDFQIRWLRLPRPMALASTLLIVLVLFIFTSQRLLLPMLSHRGRRLLLGSWRRKRRSSSGLS